MHYWTEQNYTLNIQQNKWMWHDPGLEIKDLELMILHELTLPSSGNIQGWEVHLIGEKAFQRKDKAFSFSSLLF